MSNSSINSNTPRRSISKICFTIFGATLLFIILCVTSLPSILSTAWGNEKIAQFVNSQISGKIAFKNLYLSWFGEQSLQDTQLFDVDGYEIAAFKRMSVHMPLWKLLLKQGHLGAYELTGLNAQIVQESDGKSNILEALARKDSFIAQKVSPSNVNKTSLNILLNDVNASAVLDDKKPVVLLSGKTTQGKLQGSFNLKASLDEKSKEKIFSERSLNTDQISNLKLEINTSNFPVGLLDEVLALSNPSYKGLLLSACGDTMDLSIKQSKGTSGTDLNFDVTTPLIHGSLKALLKDNQLTVNEQNSIELTIQPQFVEHLNQFISSENKIHLKNSTVAHFILSKMNLVFDFEGKNSSFINLAKSSFLAGLAADNINLQVGQPHNEIFLQNLKLSVDTGSKGIYFSDLSHMHLKGLLDVEQINVSGKSYLQKFSLPWEINGPENLITLQMHGITKLSEDISSPLEGSLRITKWRDGTEFKIAQAGLDSQIKLHDFPIIFVEKISGQKKLVELIGQAINLDFNMHIASLDKLKGSIQLAVNNTDFSGQGFFNLEKGLLVTQSNTPTFIKMVLTPERFQIIRQNFLTEDKQLPAIILATPSQVALNITSLSMPLETKDFQWLKASITSDLSVDSLKIKNKNTQHQVWLEDIHGTIESPELARHISFSLEGKHHQEDEKLLPFSIKGKVDNLFKSTNELNMDNLALQVDTKFQKFPVKLLGDFLSIGKDIPQKIGVILGEAINADVHLQIDHLQGPVVANLNGPKGSIELDAQVNHGVLTLNKNFHAQSEMTEEFGKVILEDIFPLAKGLIGADNPLNIIVSANGFALPIKNFDLNNVKIESATLEMGKVRFRKGGQLGSILSLFNASGSDVISVWFTPLYINMQKGTVTFKRMDMLIMDTYPIATWGLVNLAADKVNMTIGLSGQALLKAFNIEGLGSDYMMQIPYKGTISTAAIDKKKAATKIAALVASNRGTEGLLIGTALHIASGGLSEEKAPPPSTNPLPWSTGEASSKSPSASKSKTTKQEVEEKASSLLQNLFLN